MPGMPPAPGNTGPATPGQANTGNAAAALPMIRNALSLLQQALPAVPMGTPAHTALLNAVKSISSHVEELGSGQSQGMDMQSLMQLMRQQGQQAPMQALMRMYPQQEGGAPAGGPQQQGVPNG